MLCLCRRVRKPLRGGSIQCGQSIPKLTCCGNGTGKNVLLLSSGPKPFRSQQGRSVQFAAGGGRQVPGGRGWLLGVGLGVGLVFGVKEVLWGSLSLECQEGSLLLEKGRAQEGRGYSVAVENSRDLLQRIKDEVGTPGIVVGVSVDGKEVWSEGLGYADVENRVPCNPETVMRIASISKSLTMTAVAKLWEEGKLDFDAPVQKYVPEFPEKEYEGEKATVTSRLLVSHLSGIRHYEKDVKKVKEEKEKANRALKLTKEAATGKTSEGDKEKQKEEVAKREDQERGNESKTCEMDKSNYEVETKGKNSKPVKRKKEFEMEEYYLKDKFDSVIDSLKLFKNDPLIFKPGSQFLYSTHAWTLLSAVVERASGEKFLDFMKRLFRDLGMLKTFPDENEPIIYNRARDECY
nr:PREDICTED: serine beta-lactamase-like protein LACTB, mitochondrial [Latimeria chalumnae]|eukprot:XP_005987831.1 PREDICTED: serine beta-lactamase-like protein LACTB, mitochondrial [Latimeria chalumnae]